MRPLSSARALCAVATIATLVTACSDSREITNPSIPAQVSHDASESAAPVVNVADVEQLYDEVNDAANAGATIRLAAGRYVLSARDTLGVARPNGGRLELQQDMSMAGVDDDRAAVVINAAGLPPSSFPTPFGRTGIIRVGRGSNAVEWLTVEGNPLAAAAIETDLGSTLDATVRVAHVVAGNSARGVDVRNVGATMAGRRLHAELIDNDFFRGVEGLRVASFVGAHGSHITVNMSRNRSYENVLGCILENNRSNASTIHVRSTGDSFYDNGWGCQVGGGLASSAVANANTTVFEAHASYFIDNTRTEFYNNTGQDFGTDYAGLLVIGGETLSATATTSQNTVVVRLWGSKVAGNQRADLDAWGAHARDASRIAGVDNHALIELHGVSKKVEVVGGNSSPTDPTGSNTLTVIR